jgi:hypothetical protein
VLDNDIGGADGPAVTGAVVGVRAGSDTSTSAIGGLNSNINGTYGYLTLDANGNAVYHSNPNAVNGPVRWMCSPTPCAIPMAMKAPRPSPSMSPTASCMRPATPTSPSTKKPST